MEDLNKHQLVLLTLLVSFVTSIATGIITYTLLQEAPVEVTQNINRVVERTIEKVAPTEGGKEVVREVQVVTEEDLVLKSIEKSAKSIVRLKTVGINGTEVFAGLGIVVADGVVVTDSKSITSGLTYTLVFQDGKEYNASKTHTENGFVFIKVGKPANEKYVYYPAALGSADALKLGQTVIAVSGRVTNTVSLGRVSQIQTSESGSISKIITDINKARSQFGSPLLNLNGEVVGIEGELSEADQFLEFDPISLVKTPLKAIVAELEK